MKPNYFVTGKYSKELNRLETIRAMSMEDRLKVLAENNQRLVFKIASRYGYDEDIVQIGNIGLLRAINTFDPDKGFQFATYASRCINNEILMSLRKINKYAVECSLEMILSIDSQGNELTLVEVLGEEDNNLAQMEKDEEIQGLISAIDRLSVRERKLICLLYGIGCERKNQKEVGTLIGVSQSNVCRLEKTILEKLRKRITQN